MSVYATIDLDSLMCRLSDTELKQFMLETFHDRVPDELQVSIITKMFDSMYKEDKKEALTNILKNFEDTSSAIRDYYASIPEDTFESLIIKN